MVSGDMTGDVWRELEAMEDAEMADAGTEEDDIGGRNDV